MGFHHVVIHLDPTNITKNSVTVDGVPMRCNYVKVEAEAKRVTLVTLRLLAEVDVEVTGVREFRFVDDGEQEVAE